MSVNVDGRTDTKEPTIAALVEVMVPTDVMLLKVNAPFRLREAKLAAPAVIGLVETMLPTTVRDAMRTLLENVDGRTA